MLFVEILFRVQTITFRVISPVKMQNGHALTQDICQNLKMGLLPGAFSLMWGAAFGAIIGVKRDAPLLPQRADIKSPTPPNTAPAPTEQSVIKHVAG